MLYKKLSIIIPTHNEGEWLEKTVDSITKSMDDVKYEVIIVADDVTYNSLNFLNENRYDKYPIYLYKKSFSSVSKSRNFGAKKSKGNLLLFVDSHVIVKEKSIKEIIKLLQLKNAGLVSLPIAVYNDEKNIGHIYTIGNYKLDSAWMDLSNIEKTFIEVPCVLGAFFGVKKDVFYKIGQYDDNFTRWGINDIEISLRSWLCGYDNYISLESNVVHLFKSKFNYQVNQKNIDVNILRTIGYSINNEYGVKIINEVSKNDTFSESLISVISDSSYWKRKSKSQKRYVRSFDDYYNKFRNVLFMKAS